MSHTEELSRSKKTFFSIIILLIVYLFVEIFAQVAFRSIYSFSYKPTKLARLTASSWMFNQDDVGMPSHFSQLVIHPYLGFAINHEARTETQFGFTQKIPQDIPSINGQHFRILVLGGSVAQQLSTSVNGASALEVALNERASEIGGSQVRMFFSAAMPGFKQPQQLLAYNYLASLGMKFDLVINIDGFNEMTLAMLEGKNKGLHPSYPRGWDSLVGNQATAGKLRSIGKLLRVRDEQESTLKQAQKFPRSAILGLYFANRVLRNERKSTALVTEIEHNKKEKSLSFEAGGPTFDLHDAPATYKYLSDLWWNSSNQLALSVAANGAQYIQVFQPNQYIEGSKTLSELELNKFYVPDEGFGKIFNEALPSFNAVMKKMETNTWFLDSSMVFIDETDTVYSDVCCHLNEQGLKLLAKQIISQVEVSRFKPTSNE